ncbi:MAG: gluconate kinase, partial [Candidatus Dormibacteraeota bacterium]|nr:gluconate kinase [Candidatus Dormibacteraeota bacterium]
MRRLPDSRRLAALVTSGADVHAEVREIARTIAAYHLSAPCSPTIAATGTPDAISRRWHDSLAVLDRFAGTVLDPTT